MVIEENENGDVEAIDFKIIRKREFKDVPKLHMLIRQLPKMLENKHAKKELENLLDIDIDLTPEECFDKEGNEYDEKTKDLIWGRKYNSAFIHRVKIAKRIVEDEKERETTITLLEAALTKLEHDNMDPEAVGLSDLKKAMNLAKEIKETADGLESTFYHLQKNWKKKLKNNFN